MIPSELSRVRPLPAVFAWVFGFVPADIERDVRQKQPAWIVHRFRRGTSIDLEQQDRHSAFVPAVELWGWLELRPVRRCLDG